MDEREFCASVCFRTSWTSTARTPLAWVLASALALHPCACIYLLPGAPARALLVVTDRVAKGVDLPLIASHIHVSVQQSIEVEVADPFPRLSTSTNRMARPWGRRRLSGVNARNVPLLFEDVYSYASMECAVWMRRELLSVLEETRHHGWKRRRCGRKRLSGVNGGDAALCLAGTRRCPRARRGVVVRRYIRDVLCLQMTCCVVGGRCVHSRRAQSTLPNEATTVAAPQSRIPLRVTATLK